MSCKTGLHFFQNRVCRQSMAPLILVKTGQLSGSCWASTGEDGAVDSTFEGHELLVLVNGRLVGQG